MAVYAQVNVQNNYKLCNVEDKLKDITASHSVVYMTVLKHFVSLEVRSHSLRKL